MATRAKTRVAILGGGPGALAAAFALTQDTFRERYDVTVYQQGWRLGGKCASGREAPSQRIQEHGLHMLLGFYDTTFELMRSCYAEWNAAGSPAGGPFKRFEDALEKQELITLQEQLGSEGAPRWNSWNVPFPALPGVPGHAQRPSLMDLSIAFVDWVARKHRHVKIERLRSRALRTILHWLSGTESMLGAAWKGMAISLPVEKAAKLTKSLGQKHRDPKSVERALFVKLLRLIELAAEDIEALLAIEEENLRHDVLLLRLGYAALRGLVHDVLLHGGDFSRIDHLDFRTWLQKHGARESDVWSPPVKALYDLGFAYASGDPANPQAAAGVALYVSLRIMFGCRGSLLWKMKAGAGDTLFTPLYEVLKKRGVRFQFFHRVEHLKLSPDKTMVESIRLTRQAKTTDPSYDPLLEVPYEKEAIPLRCWPSEPLWEKLANGNAIAARLRAQGISFESFSCRESVGETTIERGKENGFDLVILGIPVASLPHICQDLIHARPAWRAMVEGISTVQTQSLQLWMRPDLKGLGWTAGSTVSISYVEPFDAWGEMSHLLPAEPWLGSERPGSIQYFCNAMPDTERSLGDPGLAKHELRLAEAHADGFLGSAIGHLWPRSLDAAGKFDHRKVVHRYVRANFDPSERYVLSVPGSISRRLWPHCSTFANLYLTGDWVMGDINSGSVEAAMQAGVRAAGEIQKLSCPPEQRAAILHLPVAV